MSLIAEVGDILLTSKDIEWKIRDFFSLSDKVDSFYESPIFSFADAVWVLSMYPNGESEQSSTGYIGLYLVRKDAGPPKTVHYTFGIKGTDGIEKKEDEDVDIGQFLTTSPLEEEDNEEDEDYDEEEEDEETEFSKEKGYVSGCAKFWSRTGLNIQKLTLLPNNNLTVACHIRSNTPCALKGSGENKLLISLLSMLESGDDSDFIIKVQGKEFPVHRNILRARSTVFKSMLTHDMLEKQNNVVKIEDGDPDTFMDFLVHIYSGSCGQISSENVFSLYTAADKYDVEELKGACVDFMKRNISVTSFCDTIAIALKHDEQELIEYATTFFCDNTLDIAKTADWQTFLRDNVTVGNELFIKAVSMLSQLFIKAKLSQ